MDVFLSYSSTNHIYAQQMQDRLTAAGLKVWQDRGQLQAGDDWRDTIDQGLTACKCIVVILTPSACASSYVTYEWAYAYGQGKTVIPVVFEECDRHPRLEAWQCEFFTHAQHQPWDRVIARVQEIADKPPGVARQSADAGIESVEAAKPSDRHAAAFRILDYLDSKGLTMISFEGIQEHIDPSYSLEFLRSLAAGADRHFRNRTLKGGKPGLGRMTAGASE